MSAIDRLSSLNDDSMSHVLSMLDNVSLAQTRSTSGLLASHVNSLIHYNGLPEMFHAGNILKQYPNLDRPPPPSLMQMMSRITRVRGITYTEQMAWFPNAVEMQLEPTTTTGTGYSNIMAPRTLKKLKITGMDIHVGSFQIPSSLEQLHIQRLHCGQQIVDWSNLPNLHTLTIDEIKLVSSAQVQVKLPTQLVSLGIDAIDKINFLKITLPATLQVLLLNTRNCDLVIEGEIPSSLSRVSCGSSVFNSYFINHTDNNIQEFESVMEIGTLRIVFPNLKKYTFYIDSYWMSMGAAFNINLRSKITPSMTHLIIKAEGRIHTGAPFMANIPYYKSDAFTQIIHTVFMQFPNLQCITIDRMTRDRRSTSNSLTHFNRPADNSNKRSLESELFSSSSSKKPRTKAKLLIL